ncbi:MAG: UDP-N-acetylmuramoyl-tripeptide--D-alanyl-D-alanine ligase [Lachnospiraceae bacterium]|nr:UDP-N-acetylmuramoyl-tripeptide--D-alanyl-D-alanine ligase [Lachnospiraceae bacterium]
MRGLTLSAIAKACGGQLVLGPACDPEAVKQEITCAVLDSRKVEKGGLFFANEGAQVDGHKFIGQVYERGALLVVCEKNPETVEKEHGVLASSWGAYILVDNTLQALKDIATFYREQLTIPVVGITGSVGKTSTKEFIASVLAQKYEVLKTEGNFNNEVGLPLTLLRIQDHHQVAVVEMGISDFGEMHRLSQMAKPDICVLTNIGQCHLENLGTRDGILKAKTEIFDFMAEDGYVCAYGEDDKLSTLGKVKGREVTFFGMSNEFPVYADQIENKGLFGSEAILHVMGQMIEVQIPLPGQHMVVNATAAAAVANLLGLDMEQIAQGIESVQAVGGRSHIMALKDYTLIDDCYNANPVSMCAAIDLLKMANGRKVAVLGDMFELGTDSDQMHARVGAYASEQSVDVIICVGENSKHMYDAAALAKTENQQVQYFATRDEMMAKLPAMLVKGDTILVKASHGMGFDQVVGGLSKGK